MITCINRCVLMISLAMPGIRNGICNAALQYKGESLGRYIRERKLLLAARDLRDTDQRVYDICLKYGFDSQQTFTRVFYPDLQSAAGRLPQREPQSRPLRRASWFNARGKTSDATPSAAPDTQWRPALRTTDKTAPYRAG